MGSSQHLMFRPKPPPQHGFRDWRGTTVRSNDGKCSFCFLMQRFSLSSAPPVISHYNLYRNVLCRDLRHRQELGYGARVDSTGGRLAQTFNNIAYAITPDALAAFGGSPCAGVGSASGLSGVSSPNESYGHPVIILMTVPLAMLGALAFLPCLDRSQHFYAQVGLAPLSPAPRTAFLILEGGAHLKRHDGKPGCDCFG